MKLRNKKTGKVTEIEEINLVVWDAERDCYESFEEYHSLAELNKEWEDYKPAEPLIKDEKIRKAVRAWAEANDVEKVDYWVSDYEFQGMQSGSSINFEDNPIETEDRYGNDEYTIAELCGEEEE